MRILQLNLNHCEAAQDLLAQTVRELDIDVAILSEQYKDHREEWWATDTSGRAAIWICGIRQVQETMRIPNAGFTWARVDGIYFYSVYAPPNVPLEDFETLLSNLVNDIMGRHPVIVAGDFNAWAVEWGSKWTNRRGATLLDAFAPLNVVLLNSGTEPTFAKGGTSSMVDLTFASESLVVLGTTWEVCGNYTHSDHQAILCILAEHVKHEKTVHGKGRRWSTKTFDKESFMVMMKQGIALDGTPDNMADQVMSRVSGACDASMAKLLRRDRRPPIYWWNGTIAELRKRCHKSRRIYQRERARGSCNRLLNQFKQDRRDLSRAIKASKRECWRELCKEVDVDPWGRPYRVVMAKLKSSSRSAPTCPMLLRKIVRTLFPHQPNLRAQTTLLRSEDVAPIEMEELLAACRKIGDNKAPGPDGIPNVALKLAVRTSPEIFLEMYNECLRKRVFPRRWKQQRLVLLPKGGRDPNDPASYRPLCLLDTAGKIYERVICDRLEAFIENTQGLSDNQFGFRRARSTVEAIKKVVETASAAVEGKRWRRGSKKYCAVVTLDVKNAFNSASWGCILDALHRLEVPEYIISIVTDYFKNRTLMYDTRDGPGIYNVTGGVPQGAVLAPTLWNTMYDAVLRLQLPQGAETIGFADDLAVTVVAKHLEEVVQIGNEAIRIIRQWLTSVDLQLANHKTEAVLITSRKKRESVTFTVGRQRIRSQPYLRYLGVWVDARLRFDAHLRSCSERASGVAAALARVMPNTGGPRQDRRKLISSVTTSILLYAAPIWAGTLETKEYGRGAVTVYRRCALRIACAFRTVSYEAACVVAEMPPIELLAAERQQVYYRKQQEPQNPHVAKSERSATIARWQSRWNASTKGRWTHRLIPDIASWMERKHGGVGYYLTQMLTGHGCFRAYQYRFKLDDDPACPACPQEPENAEHAYFVCPRFQEEREDLRVLLQQQQLTPEETVTMMLARQECWDAVADFAARVGKKLRLDERERRGVTA